MQDNQYRQIRIEKLEKLKALGVEAYPAKAKRTHGIAQIVSQFESQTAETLEAEPVVLSVMGRVIAIREMGKSVFMHLTEGGQKLQAYFRKNDLEETWEALKLLDLGDFISVTGPLMRTKTGELSVRVQEMQFLTKALLPLPEKWHGLQDKELRYRQRYLDLVSNPEVLQTFQMRSRIVAGIRRYMEGQGFLEVETPMMVPIPGGATARPFVTHHNALNIPLYLRIAPELYLKRLIVGGFEKVFEINRNFRNEGVSHKHNPEFTMMESYSAGDDLRDVMVLTENLFHDVANQCGAVERPFGEHTIHFQTPFRRLTLKDSIAEYGGIDRARLEDPAEILKLAKEVHVQDADKKAPGMLLGELFDHFVEAKLIQPTFITEYPVELSPLTKNLQGSAGFVDRFELFMGGMELANAYSELNDPLEQMERFQAQLAMREGGDEEAMLLDQDFVDRFELFMGGMELANAYSELNDPVEQMERFQAQLAMREGGDEEAMLLDQDFVDSLEHGFPPTGGLGVGIDRMVMLMTNHESIRDVILFPLMRPQGAAKQEQAATEAEGQVG